MAAIDKLKETGNAIELALASLCICQQTIGIKAASGQDFTDEVKRTKEYLSTLNGLLPHDYLTIDADKVMKAIED